MIESSPPPSEVRPWRPSPLIYLSLGLHGAAALTLAAAPAFWPQVLAAVVANHAVLSTAGVWPRSRLLGPNFYRLPESAAYDDRVALTFDDGPDPEVTPQVLDLLDAYGARASFFLIGRRADDHPEVVAEIVRRGHLVENHTYGHANTFAFFGPRTLTRDVGRAQECLERAAGRRPVWFRAPAGIRNPWVELVLARLGLHLASWTRRGYDAVDRDPKRVTRRLVKGLAARDVLLLHDGSVTLGRKAPTVVLEVLPRLLDAMAERGLGSIHLPPPTEALRPCRESSGT